MSKNALNDLDQILYTDYPEFEFEHANIREPNTLPPEKQTLVVGMDKRKMDGAPITYISGFVGRRIDLLKIEEALQGGVRLVATSPEYRDGYTETQIGSILERHPEPVFLMTQVPTQAWQEGSKTVAFHRRLRESLGRLRRGNVEGLLIRNAEPEQLLDPEFREFAEQAKTSGYVQRIGVSGHGTDLEKVLEIVAEDPLYEIILFAAYLIRYEPVLPLLERSRELGKILIAMRTRELAMEDRLPGWEEEAARQRHVPWDGRWGEAFTRSALSHAMADSPAGNALVSLRDPADVAMALRGKGDPID